MQSQAVQWCHSRNAFNRLQRLQDAEELAAYSMWRWVITADVSLP